MEQKLITVVVPVYKAESCLDRCVGSIVNQSYRNLEIILVDDGSPDQCPQMCDDWVRRDSRIRVIHKVNEGAGVARNMGLSCAKGDYICFFDSDDFVAEEALQKAVSFAEKERSDVVLFGAHHLNKAGTIVNTVIPATEKPVFEGGEIRNVFLPDLIENGYDAARNTGLILSFWVCLFSMDLIRRAGWQIVSEREFASEDTYSLLGLYAYVNKVAILPEALYYYRLSDGSLSRTYREDGYRRFRKFYGQSVTLAERLGYPMAVRKRLAGLYLSQVIGIMKQIATAKLDNTQRKNLVRDIVTDDVLQDALKEIDWKYRSRAKQFLLEQMRHRRFRCVYELTKLQAYKEMLGKMRKTDRGYQEHT